MYVDITLYFAYMKCCSETGTASSSSQLTWSIMTHLINEILKNFEVENAPQMLGYMECCGIQYDLDVFYIILNVFLHLIAYIYIIHIGT